MSANTNPHQPVDERDPTVVSDEWQYFIDQSIQRALAAGRVKGSVQNLKSYGKRMALEFQTLGVFDPREVDREAFIAWHAILEGNGFADDYRVKRNDTAKRVFEHPELTEQIELGSAWKITIKAPEIKFFTDEERYAVRDNIISLAEDEDTLMYAVAGVIAMFASPRVSDIASAKWADFKFNVKVFSYIAQKNGNRCTAPMGELFTTIMRAWQSHISGFEDADVWVFPKSVIAKEGGRKNNSPIVSEKTVRKWLNEKVRDLARLPDGSQVQKLSPHHWRHTNAMAILRETGDYYLVRGLLGDSIKTIERRYSTFIYNEAAGERLSGCLDVSPNPAENPAQNGSGGSPEDAPERMGVWPYKQMVKAANGKGKSGISPNGLAQQVFRAEALAVNRPAAPYSETRPPFLEWIVQQPRPRATGSGSHSGYGGLGQI